MNTPLDDLTDDLTDDLDFDTLLSLESTFYDTGYTQGHRDGLRQSQFESRVFGVEQGYLKGVAMGRLMARAGMWKARLGAARQRVQDDTKETKAANDDDKEPRSELPPLHANERLQKTLEKHVEKLLVYMDQSTLSPANTDDDVAEFDDRLKKAQSKVKVIERLVGEDAGAIDGQSQESQMSNDIENPRINKIAEF